MPAFVCLFAVGSPWSERPEGETFADWARRAFGEAPVIGKEALDVPTGEQQWEFVTSITSRAGGNALLKPLSALAEDIRQAAAAEGKPAGQSKISLRNIACPATWDRQVVVQRTDWTAWLLVPLDLPLRTGVAARDQLLRPHPDLMGSVFETWTDEAAVGEACKAVIEGALGGVAADGAPARKKQKTMAYQQKTQWEMLQLLVQWMAPNRPGTPGQRRVLTPAEIKAACCPCAQGERFPQYLVQDCGLDVFVVTPTVLFDDEAAVIPAVVHAVKFQLLSGICTTPIFPRDILRGMVDQEDRNTLRVLASYTDWARGPNVEQQQPQEWQTDKHRLLWLCKTADVKNLCQGMRQGSTASSITLRQSLAECCQSIWRAGSLHVVRSAPKQRYAPRTVHMDPRCKEGGDYIGMMMHWVGNYFYYHQALLKARQGQ